MTSAKLSSLQSEFSKIAQDGIVGRTQRRLQTAAEFGEPLAEAALGALAAKGLGVQSPARLAGIAALGGLHGVYRKTKKFAG